MRLQHRFLSCVVAVGVVAGAVAGVAPLAAQATAPNQPPSQSKAPPPPPIARPESATAQTTSMAVDPIRCWWRTTTGAVRTGEAFTLVLTCAVLETDAVQVVADESRLAPGVLQMAPFELMGGAHAPDQRTLNRRFFQYEYQLRVINPDYIGKDIRLPETVIHYRVNSRMAGNASLQGRDLVYLLPFHAVRVLAMVPDVATDIRDTPNDTFTTVDALRVRSSVLQVVGITLIVLGLLMALIVAVRLVRRTSRKTVAEAQAMGPRSVLGVAADELAAVQRDGEGGWNEDLVARALAAARIVAAGAIGRPTTQRLVNGDFEAGDGRLARLRRRGRATLLSSSVTTIDLAKRLAKPSAKASADRRQLLDELNGALKTLTAAQYTRDTAFDCAALDAAVSKFIDGARTLRADLMWPKPQLRRLTQRTVEPEGRL